MLYCCHKFIFRLPDKWCHLKIKRNPFSKPHHTLQEGPIYVSHQRMTVYNMSGSRIFCQRWRGGPDNKKKFGRFSFFQSITILQFTVGVQLYIPKVIL